MFYEITMKDDYVAVSVYRGEAPVVIGDVAFYTYEAREYFYGESAVKQAKRWIKCRYPKAKKAPC